MSLCCHFQAVWLFKSVVTEWSLWFSFRFGSFCLFPYYASTQPWIMWEILCMLWDMTISYGWKENLIHYHWHHSLHFMLCVCFCHESVFTFGLFSSCAFHWSENNVVSGLFSVVLYDDTVFHSAKDLIWITDPRVENYHYKSEPIQI